MQQKQWIIQGKKIEKKELIDVILKNRGITTGSQRKSFLNPKDPYALTAKDVGIDQRNLDKAIDRIKKAISDKEKIVVYTDYDADGITGGAIMWEALYDMGALVMPYVPHRVDEGYGFSTKGIDTVIKLHNPSLIISVDHGITATEKVAYAKKKGIDIIITDHHSIPTLPPKAFAIVHTTQLSGSGVSWFLAKELQKKSNNEHLSLATVGTIADLVPLIGPNRSIALFGLKAINQTKRLGLKALIDEAGITTTLEPYHISHMLAPRINATGRLTHALDALRLLCTKDSNKAATLANLLGTINRERQGLLEEALLHAREHVSDKTPPLLFLAHEDYNQGIIGLVAGRLVEELYRPAIVLWKGSEFSKASARSIAGINIVEVLREAQDLLVDVGGHPMAAGFTVETSKLEALQTRLVSIVEKMLTDEILTPRLSIDAELNSSDISLELLKEINALAPFGIGNPTPVFVLRNVQPRDVRLIGKDSSHVKFRIAQDETLLDVIGFRMAHFYNHLSSEKSIDIAFSLDENTWNGKTTVQLKLKDIKV